MDEPNSESGLYSKVKAIWRNEFAKTLILIGIIAAGTLAFRIVLVLALKTEYPLQTPVTRSMEPTIHVGDLLIVQGGLNPEYDIMEGDIIVFRNPNKPQELVVHRVIRKWREDGKWYFKTKGDNNPISLPFERKIPEDYIIGKVIWRIPYLGYIKMFLGTPLGMVVGILLIALFLIIENILPSRKEEAEEKSQTQNRDDHKS